MDEGDVISAHRASAADADRPEVDTGPPELESGPPELDTAPQEPDSGPVGAGTGRRSRQRREARTVTLRLPSLATVRALLRLTVLSMVAGLFFWAVAPVAFGWRAAMITSGSMEPAIRTGDLVLLVPTDADEVNRLEMVGLVVQVRNPVRPGQLLVHRVAAKNDKGQLITKGDANADRDRVPVDPQQVLGIGRIRVPYVGLPMLWAQQRQQVPLLALGLVLLVLAWPQRSRPSRDPDEDGQVQT
ncbi:MAG TPA: signal peptidase I [Actinoplanes sp.]|nr:signal peptidase I [Actinoplanes sp.]